MMFERMCSALPAITGGKLRALAVIRARRLPILPEVRTLAEAGIRAD
ncbi:MAG: tripartite tricarboxylate transporter substrate-binding protein [Burkholderiales bacterium]